MNLSTLEADQIFASMGAWDKVSNKERLMDELHKLEKQSQEYAHGIYRLDVKIGQVSG